MKECSFTADKVKKSYYFDNIIDLISDHNVINNDKIIDTVFKQFDKNDEFTICNPTEGIPHDFDTYKEIINYVRENGYDESMFSFDKSLYSDSNYKEIFTSKYAEQFVQVGEYDELIKNMKDFIRTTFRKIYSKGNVDDNIIELINKYTVNEKFNSAEFKRNFGIKDVSSKSDIRKICNDNYEKIFTFDYFITKEKARLARELLKECCDLTTAEIAELDAMSDKKLLSSNLYMYRLANLYSIENKDKFESELTKRNLATLFSFDGILKSCDITFIRRGKNGKSGLDRKYYFGFTNNMKRKGFDKDDTGDRVMEQVNDFVGFFINNFMKTKYNGHDLEADITMPGFIKMWTIIKQDMNEFPNETFSYKDEQGKEKEITKGKLSAKMLSNPTLWIKRILSTDDVSEVGLTKEGEKAIFMAFKENSEILENIKIKKSKNVSFTAFDDICSTISNIDHMGYISADITSMSDGAFLNHISNNFNYRDSMHSNLTRRFNMDPNNMINILKSENLYLDPIQPQNGIRILYPVENGLCTLTIEARENKEVSCKVTKRSYDKNVNKDNFIKSLTTGIPSDVKPVVESVTKFIEHAFGVTQEFNIANFIKGIKSAITQDNYKDKEVLSLIDDNVIEDYKNGDSAKKKEASSEITNHIKQRLEVQRRSGTMFHLIAESVAKVLRTEEINNKLIDKLSKELRLSSRWIKEKDNTDESCKISFSNDSEEEGIINKTIKDVLSDFVSEGFVERNGDVYKLKENYFIIPELFINSMASEKNGTNETRYDLNGIIDLVVVKKDKNEIKSVVLYDYKCSNKKSYEAYKDETDMKSDATIKQLSLYKRMLANYIKELGHVFNENNMTTKVIGYKYEFKKPVSRNDMMNWDLNGFSKLDSNRNSLELKPSDNLQNKINSLIQESDTNMFGMPYSVTVVDDYAGNVFANYREMEYGNFERKVETTEYDDIKEDSLILYKIASVFYGLSNNGISDSKMISLINMLMGENGKTFVHFAEPALQSLLIYVKTANISDDKALYKIKKLCGDGYIKNSDLKSMMKICALPIGDKNRAYYSDCMAIKDVFDALNGHTKAYVKSYSGKNVFTQKTSSWISSAKAHYFSEIEDGKETVLKRLGIFRDNIFKEYARYFEVNGRNGVKDVSKMSRNDLFNLTYIRSLISDDNTDFECFVPNAQADKVEIPCVVINGSLAYASAKKANGLIGLLNQNGVNVKSKDDISFELLEYLDEKSEERLNRDINYELLSGIRFETIQFGEGVLDSKGNVIFKQGENGYDRYHDYSINAANIYSDAERVETVAYYSYQLKNIYSDYNDLNAYHGYNVMEDYLNRRKNGDKKADDFLLQNVKQYNEDLHLERKISQLEEEINYLYSINDVNNAEKMIGTLNNLKEYFHIDKNERRSQKRNRRLDFIMDVHYGKGFDYAREYFSIMINKDRYDQFKKEQMIISINNLLHNDVRINSSSLGYIIRDTEKKTKKQESLKRYYDFFNLSAGLGRDWSKGSDINTEFVLFKMKIKSGENELTIPVYGKDDITYDAPVSDGKRRPLDENVQFIKRNDKIYFNVYDTKETVIYGNKWDLKEFVIYKLKSMDKDFDARKGFSVEYELHPALKFLMEKQAYLENGFRLAVNGGITQFGKSIVQAPVRLSKDKLSDFHFVLEGCIGTESKRNTKNSAPSFVFRNVNDYGVPIVNDKVVANVSVIPDSEFKMFLPFGDEYDIKTTDGVMFLDPVYFESLRESSMSNATENDVIKPYYSFRDRHTGTSGAVKCSGQNISYEKMVDSEGFMRLYKKMNSTISFKDAVEESMMNEGKEFSDSDYEKFNENLAASISNNWNMMRYFTNDIEELKLTGNKYLVLMRCEYKGNNVFDFMWGYKKGKNGNYLLSDNVDVIPETHVINNPYDLFVALGGTMMFDTEYKRSNNVFKNMNEVLSNVEYAKLAIVHMANVVSSTKFGVSNLNSRETLEYDVKYKNGQSLDDEINNFILEMGKIGINLDVELSAENFVMKRNGIIDAINRYEGPGDKTRLVNLTDDIVKLCNEYNNNFKLNYSQHDTEQFGIQGDYSDYTQAGESRSSLATQPTYLSGGTGEIAKLSKELRESISYMIGTYIDKLYAKYPGIIGTSLDGRSFDDFKLAVLNDVADFVWNGISNGMQETEFESILREMFVTDVLSNSIEDTREAVKSIMAETTSEVWAMVRDVASMIEKNGLKLKMPGDMDVLNVSHNYVKIHGWKRKSKWGIEYDNAIELAQNALLDKVKVGAQLSYDESKCVHYSPCEVYIGETYYVIGTDETGEIIENSVTINNIDDYHRFVRDVESNQYGRDVKIVDDIVVGRNLRYDNYIFRDSEGKRYGIWDFRSSYIMYEYLRDGHQTTDDELAIMRDYLIRRPDIIIDRDADIDVVRKRMQDAVQNDISSIMTEGAEVEIMEYNEETMGMSPKTVTLSGIYDYKPCECIMPEYYAEVFEKLLPNKYIKSLKMLKVNADDGEIVCMTSDGQTFIVSVNDESKYETYDNDMLEVVGEMSTKHFKRERDLLNETDGKDEDTEREVNVPVICIGKDDKDGFIKMLSDTGIIKVNMSESFNEGAFGLDSEELNKEIDSSIEKNTDKLSDKINISREVLRYIFCSRTPAQSKQSGMQMYVVDYMDNNYNNVYVSALQLLLHGSDFDIDKITMYLFELNKKTGKIMLWSDFSNYDSVENVKESMKLPLPEKISLSFEEFKRNRIVESQPKAGKWKESYSRIVSLIGDQNIPSGKEGDMENWKMMFDTKDKLKALSDFIYDVREDREVFRCEMDNDKKLADTAASLYYSFNLNHDIKKEAYQSFFVHRIQTIYSHPQTYHEVHTPVDIYGSVKKLNDENKVNRNNAGSGPGCMCVTIENIQRAQEGAGTIGFAATASKVLHALMNVLNDFSIKDATSEEVSKFFINTNFNVQIQGKDYRNVIGAVKIALSPDMIDEIDEKYRKYVDDVFKHLKINQKDNADVLFAIMKVASQLDENELPEYKEEIKRAIKEYIKKRYKYEASTSDLESIMTNEHWNSYEGLNIISELITAAVDNAKDQVLCNINGGKNFISLYVAGVALGIDFNELSNILMSDVAKNIFQIMQGNFFENIDEMSFEQIISNADKNKIDIPNKIRKDVKSMLRAIIDDTKFDAEVNEIRKDYKNADDKFVTERILFDYTHHSSKKRDDILNEINQRSSNGNGNKFTEYEKIKYAQLYNDIINIHKISNIKNSDKKSFENIKKLANMSREMVAFSSFANLRSLKKTAQDILSLMNRWSNIYENQVRNDKFRRDLADINQSMSDRNNGRSVKENTVDVEMLVRDEKYLNELIELQGDQKTFINPLYLLRNNSDYWASFKSQVLAMIASKALSNTFRISDVFASAAINSIGKGKVKDVYRKAGKFIISNVMNDYLYSLGKFEIDGSLIKMSTDNRQGLNLDNIQIPVSLGSNFGNLTFIQAVEHILDEYTYKGELITVDRNGKIFTDGSVQLLKQYLYKTTNKSLYMDMSFSCYRLLDSCYDSKADQTLNNMKIAFNQIRDMEVPIKIGDKYMTFGQMMSLYNSVMYLNDGERSFRPMLKDDPYYTKLNKDYSRFSDGFDYEGFSKDQNAIDLFVETCIPVFKSVSKAVDFKGKLLYIQTPKMYTYEKYEKVQEKNEFYDYDDEYGDARSMIDDNDVYDLDENSEDIIADDDESLIDYESGFDTNVLEKEKYRDLWKRNYETLDLHYNAYSSVPVANAPVLTREGRFNIGEKSSQTGKYFRDKDSGLEISFGSNGYLSRIAVLNEEGKYDKIDIDIDGSFVYNDKYYNFDEYLKAKKQKIQTRYSLSEGIVPDVDSMMAQLKDMLNIDKC